MNQDDPIQRYLRHEISIGKLVELVTHPYDLIGGFANYIDELKQVPPPLRWENLQINANKRYQGEWKNRNGETRVHVSLIDCSFVMHTFWIKGFNPDSPVTRAMILLMMNKKLNDFHVKMKKYLRRP